MTKTLGEKWDHSNYYDVNRFKFVLDLYIFISWRKSRSILDLDLVSSVNSKRIKTFNLTTSEYLIKEVSSNMIITSEQNQI